MPRTDAHRIVTSVALLTLIAVGQLATADDVWMVIEQVGGVEESFFDAYLMPASADAVFNVAGVGEPSWLESCPCLPPGGVCPCPTLEPGVPVEPGEPSTPTPSDVEPAPPTAPETPSPTPPPVQADFGALQGGSLLASASVPGMMGDFFGGGRQLFIDDVFSGFVPDPAVGGFVGRQKLSENTSPIPRDRVFVNYSYFNNTPLRPGGLNVNRITPGFEITYFDGLASIEARFPMASTLNSNIRAGSPAFAGTDTSHNEFGNITLFAKHVLWEGQSSLVSAGVGVALPTADDMFVQDGSGDPLLVAENEAVHILPFIGGAYLPNNRFFAQWIAQLDVDANGQPVQTDFNGQNFDLRGDLQDRTYLFVDASVGYWLHRDPYATSGLTGFAPIAEVHMNQSLTKGDSLSNQVATLGRREHFTLFNAVIGATAQFGQNVTFHAGYGFPLGGGSDSQYNGELRLILNWFFGGPRRYPLLPN